MISVIDTSINLKESDCEGQSPESQNLPSPNDLFSDDMTRSVPSIRSQSSQEFVSCATTFNSGRRNSRKGRPNRSCSWQDSVPGIVFKFNDDSQTILVIPNNISSRDLDKINIFDKNERKIRSQSITNLGSYVPYPNRRPRSFSVDCSALNHSSSLNCSSFIPNGISSREIRRGSVGNFVNEIDEDDASSESGRDSRKSSISSNSGSQTQKKKFNAAGNSLSHLVPNKLLSTLSRRISANSSHEQCRCSSCNQSVTPYWRDGWAEDVMLCNACGLRFQKFAQRCMYCKYIPRKEDGVDDTCPQCQAPWEC